MAAAGSRGRPVAYMGRRKGGWPYRVLYSLFRESRCCLVSRGVKSNLASSSSEHSSACPQLCSHTTRSSEAGPLGVLASKPTKLAVYCKSFTIKYSKIETEKVASVHPHILGNTFWDR